MPRIPYKDLMQSDEMAEKLGMDPVEFRIRNDTQVDPQDPQRPFLAGLQPLPVGEGEHLGKFGGDQQHAFALASQLLDKRVDLGLGADVDAALAAAHSA